MRSDDSRPRSVGGAFFAALLVLGLVALFAYAPIFAVDFFWHLKLGELIVQERAIPQLDLFSAVHPEQPYVQFQWLWELIAYAAYRLHGLHGVRVMQVIVLVLSFAALGWVSWRQLRTPSLAFMLVAIAVVWFEDRFQARPSSTALGLLAVSLPWLMDEQPGASTRELALLALLACIWSNLHGGEVLLLVLCLGARAAGFALEARWDRRDPRVRAAWLRTVGAGFGAAVSPVFLPGLATWGKAIGPQLSSGNREWLPSYSMLAYGFSPSHVMIAFGPTVVLALYVAEQWRAWRRTSEPGLWRAPWSEWLLIGGVLVLAHQAVRNVFLAIIPVAFMLRRTERPRPRLAVVCGVGLLAAAAHNHVFEGYGGIDEARHALRQDLAPNSFPEELVAFMREAQIEGPVLNDGRWGGYLIWTVWPRSQIFVDSRHHLDAEMWRVFLASQSPHLRPGAMDHAFRRWGVELAAFRGPTFPAIQSMGAWQLLYKAGDEELYQHLEGKHAPANIARASRWLTAQIEKGELDTLDVGSVELPVQVGAARWLAAPYRRFQRERARTLAQSADVATKVRGLSIEAGLMYEAGLFAPSLSVLHEILALDAKDVTARYRAAFASFALGRREEARHHFVLLRPHSATLSKHQIERLSVLSRLLAR